jgi:hypothetical protein
MKRKVTSEMYERKGKRANSLSRTGGQENSLIKETSGRLSDSLFMTEII